MNAGFWSGVGTKRLGKNFTGGNIMLSFPILGFLSILLMAIILVGCAWGNSSAEFKKSIITALNEWTKTPPA